MNGIKTMAERLTDAVAVPLINIQDATGIPALTLWKMMQGWIIPTAEEADKIDRALRAVEAKTGDNPSVQAAKRGAGTPKRGQG
ncbi:MAG: hypothetical protein AAB649_02755, partial [Patescibacteria group bacterium]